MSKVLILRRSLFDFAFSTCFASPIFFLLMGGWTTLNPRNYQWIAGDNTAGYIAQLFYLSDSWRFPLASNPKFGLDLSTSLIYSGPPLPIVVLQKLFNIDASLQFIGFWLLLMIILQIFFGILIARELHYASVASRLAGLLFVTPFFLYRFQVHFWLTAHFLLLWSLWITMRSLSKNKLYTLEISIFVFIAYSVNTYILVMSLIILSYPTILIIFKSRTLSLSIIKHSLFILQSLIACYLLFDFRVQKGTFSENFIMNFTGEYTHYPANLLALFNPEVGYARNCNMGHCIFGEGPIPSHYIKNFSILNYDLGGVQGNFEGFLYLGLGIIFLLLIAIYPLLSLNNRKLFLKNLSKYRLLLAYVALISSYAITYKISVGSYQLNPGDPKLVRWALSTFRASGRFMWIVAYFLIILSLFLLSRRVKKSYMPYLLSVAILIQTIDLYPAMINRYSAYKRSNLSSIFVSQDLSDKFGLISQGKDTLIMFPPGTTEGWPELAYLAWKSQLRSGMFASSRINSFERNRLESNLRRDICFNSIKANWLIAIPISEFPLFTNCELNSYEIIKVDKFVFLRKT